MKWTCKEFCKRDDFPIPQLLNRRVYEYFGPKGWGLFYKRSPEGITKTSCRYYNYKHWKLGMAKCKICDYITADAVDVGTRCACCSALLARSINHKNSRVKTFHKRIE